jgi:hypothetical protein
MTKYNVGLVTSLKQSINSTKIDENTILKAEEELCSVVRDAHEQECCVNYEQLDTTLQSENL